MNQNQCVGEEEQLGIDKGHVAPNITTASCCMAEASKLTKKKKRNTGSHWFGSKPNEREAMGNRCSTWKKGHSTRKRKIFS